jgi:hypothetical protein
MTLSIPVDQVLLNFEGPFGKHPPAENFNVIQYFMEILGAGGSAGQWRCLNSSDRRGDHGCLDGWEFVNRRRN